MEEFFVFNVAGRPVPAKFLTDVNGQFIRDPSAYPNNPRAEPLVAYDSYGNAITNPQGWFVAPENYNI
jgi:hypothetical protein